MQTCLGKYAQGKAEDAAPHSSPTGTGRGEQSVALCSEPVEGCTLVQVPPLEYDQGRLPP